MAKNILKTEIEADFHLLGIVANTADYNMAWHINELLHIHLKRVDDHKVQFKSDKFLSTSKFIYETEYCSYTLIQNRVLDGEGFNFVLREIKNIDYLLIIHDETDNLKILNVKSTLSKIKNVILVQNLDVSKIKSLDNLYDD